MKPILSVDPIFEALSRCAAQHPDPNTHTADEGDDAFYDGEFETFTGGPDEELSEVGRVRSNFTNDSRFAPY